MGQVILVHLATLGPVGYIPFAPGTFGTAVGFLFLFLLKPSPAVLLTLAFISFWIGTAASHYAELHFKKKDPAQVIIDEFTGYLVTIAFHKTTILNLVLAFIFFRFFDILKPPPVRFCETAFKGGFGVMLDDIMAGVYANASVIACNYLLKLW